MFHNLHFVFLFFYERKFYKKNVIFLWILELMQTEKMYVEPHYSINDFTIM